MYRQEVRPFTEKQIALLQNFAAQAVIAMENARLLTETREALEKQTATAEVLQVINSSPGDLTRVFDAILEKALGLCEPALGMLWTYDGQQLCPAVVHGPAPFVEFYRGQQRLPPVPGSLLCRHIAGEGLVQIADLANDTLYKEGNPRRRAYVELGGARSGVSVPLRQDSTFVGAIQVYRQEVRPFSDKEIALLQNFAAQAVIAMENARLLTETREALEQQTATAEVLGVINSSPGDLAPVFDAMLEKAMRLCETTFGHLMTWDGERFHRIAFRGMPEDLVEEMRQPIKPVPGSFLEQVVQGKDLVCHTDLQEATAGSVGSGAASPMRFGARARAMVALRKDERLLGTITVYRIEVRPFSNTQIALLQNFAAQAVIAMENARLLDELRQRTDQVAELNRGLEARVAAQVEELGRVGRLKRFLAPQLAELIVSQGKRRSSKAIAAKSSSCSAICAATPLSPKPPSPRKCWIFCANITALWGRLSASSRERSTSSLAMGSWCSSMIRYRSRTQPRARSRWRWRCAGRQAS